jgi:sialic acid synthase SpsE/quercetin dioxygenase-like cupin family protein
MKYINKFNFKNLFVLDLANNHQGDFLHGSRIISECADVVDRHCVRAVIKFQFRDLPNFVHSDERKSSTNKHTPRFLSTQLSWDEFKKLLVVVRRRNMLAMCTPFDESSVDKIIEFDFDLIKVASCSARDWPLLEKIASSGLPVIASTGGLIQKEVDDLVSFLIHKGCDFALMHCVSIYPTPDDACQLGNISGFKERYPGRVVGWSTHEPPKDTVQIGLALALGAEMFERHVGVETEKIKLNAYSSTPSQIDDWFNAYARAVNLVGERSRNQPLALERKSIDELRRGVFSKNSLEVGQELTVDDIYFAFPLRPGQLASGDWKSGIILNEPLEQDQPLNLKDLIIPDDPLEQIIKNAIHEVKALLAYARVPLSHEFSTEYSHHYGVINFREIGVVLINVINRDYAKKILVQLPGQRHPMHFHKLKEETFIVLWGELISDLDGRERTLRPGDTLMVPPGVWHSFRTDLGCVFEEISTTVYSNDSVYRDQAINILTSKQRKTSVDHWGRFQIGEQLRGEKLKYAET